MSRKKLSTWAAEHGIHYRTAMKWLHAGMLPVRVEQTPGGHYRVVEEPIVVPSSGRTVLYGRVSSSDQKEDLARQVERLQNFAASQGLTEVEVITEIGSGLNGHRRQLLRLLADKSVQQIIVEHRDRLACFGVEYIEAALAAQGRTILVLEAGKQILNLDQDFVDVVTSMCARIYGRRGAANRAKRALSAAAGENP